MLAGKNLETVSEALLDKPCLMVDSLFLRFLGNTSRRALIHWLRRGHRLIHWLVLAFILALNESWSMFRPSDLQEWMAMRLFDFALLTVVEIRAYTALVANALNR